MSNLPVIDTEFDDIDLFRMGQIIWSDRKEIIRNVIVVSVLSIMLAFILPKTYRTTALIMPPSATNESGVFNTDTGLIALQSMFAPNLNSDSNTFLAILKSRTVMYGVINKFNLVEFYEVENNEKAQSALVEDTNFEIDEEGTIRINTDIKTGWFHTESDEELCKALSKDITNDFVFKLDEVNKKIKSEEAKQYRIFIENRYNKIIKDLEIAEERLRAFQEEHNTVSLPEQTTAAIEVASQLVSRLSISKVKLSILEGTLPKDHPEIIVLKSEISGLNLQLQELNHGVKETSLIPAFSKMPDLGLEHGRLIRDLEVQNTLYTFLTQQYEEAKIQEARDTPTVQVLDNAILPELKYKPVRSRIVIVAFVLSAIFSIYFVYFRTRWKISQTNINK